LAFNAEQPEPGADEYHAPHRSRSGSGPPAAQAIRRRRWNRSPRERRVDRQQAENSDDGIFRAAAELWYKSKQDAGRSASTLDKIRTYLDKDILPELGSSKLVNITRVDCARVQERFEKRDALNVSKKARGWLREIFSQAIARGKCEYNPASELKVIAKPAPKAKPYPHLLEPELPDFLRALEKSASRLIAYVAAWMTIWTASRPGMVRCGMDRGRSRGRPRHTPYCQHPPSRTRLTEGSRRDAALPS